MSLISKRPCFFYGHKNGVQRLAIDNKICKGALGNLTHDTKEGIDSVEWTVYGKIRGISKTDGTQISYAYNPSGQRVSKTVNGTTTWYVRDAQGNTMGLYDNRNGANNWREQHLYGSSRLGTWDPGIDLNNANGTAAWDTIGKKNYELTNHLGNVMATISDKRLQHSTDGTAIDYFDADVQTAQEYYSFGSVIPGRTYLSPVGGVGGGYRYGFNGKENDNEVKKDLDGNPNVGTQQDYGMRIYDPRLGRFLSVDPIFKQYPELTPYQFASNTPIQAVDLDGLEGAVPMAGTISPQDAQALVNNVHKGVANWVTRVENTYNRALNSYEFATGQPAGSLRKAQIGFSSLLWHGVGNFTHIDDVSVLKNGKHADGSLANWLDKGVSGIAIFVPLVGGQVFKKGGSALIEGIIDVFKNGEKVEVTAYKIGNYGHKGTRAFNEVVGALRKGGNYVVGSEEEGVKLLQEAFPAIKQDASGAASAFGYRIDREAEEATTGIVKQGHTGNHINYYDKKTKVTGSITIEPAKTSN